MAPVQDAAVAGPEACLGRGKAFDLVFKGIPKRLALDGKGGSEGTGGGANVVEGSDVFCDVILGV